MAAGLLPLLLAASPHSEDSLTPQYACLLQGIRGKVYPLPEFVKSAAATAAASDGGAPAAAAADQGSFLVAWDVQAEEGIGPVLLLARAAHCLQQLHAVNVARQAVAGSEHWQVRGQACTECFYILCLFGVSVMLWS